MNICQQELKHTNTLRRSNDLEKNIPEYKNIQKISVLLKHQRSEVDLSLDRDNVLFKILKDKKILALTNIFMLTSQQA